ncbi:MAG: energy transducer TonB [Lewinellaceae bacterium]|nr:energy transducer TonB [Lewinellaceae bacterium]
MKTALLFFALLFQQMNAQVISDNPGPEVTDAYFTGGAIKLGNYISQNIRYPEDAAFRHVEGVVVVTFTIDTAGVICNAQIRRGIGNGCDEEALRLVKNMPKWAPAMLNGKPVASGSTLHIDFRMPR